MAIVPHKLSNPRSERHMFSSSDDNAMMKQIQATHAPDGREFSVRPLLNLVEDIFQQAAPTGLATIVHQQVHAQLEAMDDKALQNGSHEMLEVLSYTINKISCEISCKCSGGGDAHATTLAIFHLLSSYSWDAKVVLALSAFAVNYGEFWLVAQLYLTNPLAKGIALLKQLPDIIERSAVLKPKFEALNNLIRATLDVAKCIVEFKELPSQYISPDAPEMLSATAHIPTAVYWTVRSIVACATQIIGLTGTGHEHIASTTEAWELSSLAHKVRSIHEHLMAQLTRCYHHIDEKRHLEAYQTLVRLFETIHIDNIKILRALIYAKDDQLPLFVGAKKERASLDVLRRKNVLLYISELELQYEELEMLRQIYEETRQHPTRAESQFEVVWLPVVNRSTPWNDEKQKQFESLRSMMPWYSVFHPSLLDPAVVRYIKEVWHFNKKPLLVVLDPQGKVVNPNAIHMIWIWGSTAFPFTSNREESLWKEETWRIELLADTVDPNIPAWIEGQKHICLYGGEDMDWIRKFTKTADAVARAANIQLEMLYVGKSNPRDKVRKNNSTIQAEKLSHILPDLTMIWFFWVRLESMWHSKVQHNRTVENDLIMQEIVTMLSFDGSEHGWAVISRGSGLQGHMAKAKGTDILECFEDFQSWNHIATEKGFVPALNDYLHGHHNPLHCNRLILPGTTGTIPERVVCAECNRPMEKFIMYRCCTD
ncbi:protein SIEVE ELEMENT OCCLUSION B isoform X2 [Manihot esculenta]|uniref:protein SIEVE ELEMENT OCCLUSION B isoform X2 n=1 Tax=Manihot esculenta TaxID=3983 RepID=UPI001CC40DF7|nr:protein SIEVE ELEMENT OCCLUSION B isoform X2 [Manihot esculenta]